jgi:hypothetical protein
MSGLPEVVEVSERCGKKRREPSSPVSTKCLPQFVCSILSISKPGPPVHSCVVVYSYLAQPYPHTLRTTVQLVFLYISPLGVSTGYEPWYLRLGSRMGAKDNVKSGGVIPFDHKDMEKTNHDKVQAWHQWFRACASQNLTPELVHVLFSTQIDGAKANWGYAGLPAFKTWKNYYVSIFKPGERPKKPSRSAVTNEHTYNVRVKCWRVKLQKSRPGRIIM